MGNNCACQCPCPDGTEKSPPEEAKKAAKLAKKIELIKVAKAKSSFIDTKGEGKSILKLHFTYFYSIALDFISPALFTMSA